MGFSVEHRAAAAGDKVEWEPGQDAELVLGGAFLNFRLFVPYAEGRKEVLITIQPKDFEEVAIKMMRDNPVSAGVAFGKAIEHHYRTLRASRG